MLLLWLLSLLNMFIQMCKYLCIIIIVCCGYAVVVDGLGVVGVYVCVVWYGGVCVASLLGGEILVFDAGCLVHCLFSVL